MSIALAAGLATACTGSPGDPAVKPLPQPDPYGPLLGGEALSPRIASYEIAAAFDPEAHLITGSETLTWTNTGQSELRSLPFHLYMNAFKNDDTVFMRESRGQHRRAVASKSGWGYIDVSAVRIDGEELSGDRISYPGPDETVLDIALDTPLPPGATIAIAIDFEVKLPEVFARTGYKGAFTMAGQWFPKIGVLVGEPGNETWHCEPFHLNSEFFADFGTYDVTLTVPGTHVVAATGVLTDAVDNGDGTRTLRYRAEDVHDFAWMADPYMTMMSAQARTAGGPVEVRVYHRPDQAAFARRHLEAGVGAIEQFSELYHPYPWSLMSILDVPLDAAGGAGGMEYPTLVTTAGDSAFMRPGVRMLEYVTIHEVGHNWFQGMLASNEVDEAWLDEGVNEYADAVVMEKLYGAGRSLIDWNGFRADSTRMNRAARLLTSLPSPIAIKSYAFPDFASYATATYSKTGLALRTLENIVGRDAFRAAMRAYAQAFAFKHPTGADFLGALEEALGRDLDWFWKPAFHDLGAAELALHDVHCARVHEPRGIFGRGKDRTTVTEDDAPLQDKWACEVLVANLGRVPAPVDVLIEFADGATTRQTLDASSTQAWQRLRVEHDARITRVTIDPDNAILLNDNVVARDQRMEPDPAASRRAGARIQFWTQSAMQVMGL